MGGRGEQERWQMDRQAQERGLGQILGGLATGDRGRPIR